MHRKTINRSIARFFSGISKNDISLSAGKATLQDIVFKSKQEADKNIKELQTIIDKSKEITNFYGIERRLLLVYPPQDFESVLVDVLMRFFKIKFHKKNSFLHIREFEQGAKKNRLNVLKSKLEFPLLMIDETFKDEKIFCGKNKVLEFLTNEGRIKRDLLRQESAWTQQGLEVVNEKVKPTIDAIFLHPQVD